MSGQCGCLATYYGSDCSVVSPDPVGIDCVSDLNDPGLAQLMPGESKDVVCPPGCHEAGGEIAGTSTYTESSRICKAGIHAGVVGIRGGLLTITVAGEEQIVFLGSSRNGITSVSDQGNVRGFVPSAAWEVARDRELNAKMITCDTKGREFRYLLNGETADVICPVGCGTQHSGSVFGSKDGYADESSVCRAAVHAGSITDDGGFVVLKMFPNQEPSPSTTKHGIESLEYSSFDGRTILFVSAQQPMSAALAIPSDGVLPFMDTTFDRCPGNCTCKGVCGNGGQCDCDHGHWGDDCGITLSTCPLGCSGQGHCRAGRCTCLDGFEGLYCDNPPRDLCTANCTGHGQCLNNKCHCFSGYKGVTCNEPDIPCPEPCGENAQCISGQCVCTPGWVNPPKCDELGWDLPSLEARVERHAREAGLCELLPGYPCENAREICIVSSFKEPRTVLYHLINDTATPAIKRGHLQDIITLCHEVLDIYFDGAAVDEVRRLREILLSTTRQLVDKDPSIYFSPSVNVNELLRYLGSADNVKLMLRNADINNVAGTHDLVHKMKETRDKLAKQLASATTQLLAAVGTLENGAHNVTALMTPLHPTQLPGVTSTGAREVSCRATALSWEYESVSGGDEGRVLVQCPRNCAMEQENLPGTVWGTGIFTDDSVICMAAVHAGMIEDAKGGEFFVELLPRREHYTGSTQHQVESRDHGAWMRSFRLCPRSVSGECSDVQAGLAEEAQEESEAEIQRAVVECGQPVTGTEFNLTVGEEAAVKCKGGCAEEGLVWGTDVYTSDSAICRAAVHAGAINPETGGVVIVRGVTARESYPGSDRHGITSNTYPKYWSHAYTIESTQLMLNKTVSSQQITCRASALAHVFQTLFVGQSVKVMCPGGCARVEGGVWGTDIYTDDSKICKAAVHAGVIPDTVGGMVEVTIEGGQEMYPASTRHGVASVTWPDWHRSFSVARPLVGAQMALQMQRVHLGHAKHSPVHLGHVTQHGTGRLLGDKRGAGNLALMEVASWQDTPDPAPEAQPQLMSSQVALPSNTTRALSEEELLSGTVIVINGMSVNEFAAFASEDLILTELKWMIAEGCVDGECEALMDIIASVGILLARGDSEIADPNKMYTLKLRVKQTAIEVYRLDPSVIEKPTHMSPTEVTEALMDVEVKEALRQLADEQQTLRKAIETLLGSINDYQAAEAELLRQIRRLSFEVRQLDETLSPDLTAATRSDIIMLAKDRVYMAMLRTWDSDFYLARVPGKVHALEQYIRCLETISGKLPFSPVIFGDLMAQRIFTLDVLNQLQNLGERVVELEGVEVMSTLSLNVIVTDQDVMDGLRVIKLNVLSPSNGTNGTSGVSEVVVQRSRQVANLAEEAIESIEAMDMLVRGAIYYLMLATQQLAPHDAVYAPLSTLKAEFQMHEMYYPLPWFRTEVHMGPLKNVNVSTMADEIEIAAATGTLMEPNLLALVLQNVMVGLLGVGDDETLRREAQKGLRAMQTAVKGLKDNAPQTVADYDMDARNRTAAEVVRDMAHNGLAPSMATAVAAVHGANILDANVTAGDFPLAVTELLYELESESKEIHSKMAALVDLLVIVGQAVQERLPVAMPAAQGVELDQDNVAKHLVHPEIMESLVHTLETLHVDPSDPQAQFHLTEEKDIIVARLLYLIDMYASAFMDLECPGSSEGTPCSGNGMCIGGQCICYSMYTGDDCSQRMTEQEVFDDGFRRGMEEGMKMNQTRAAQPQQIVTHAAQGLAKCGDAVKQTTKKLASLNPHCHDVWDFSRLSPMEILEDACENQAWVDELRKCAASTGASNNTAYRHLVPVLLVECATLRRGVNDAHQMLKGLAVTAATKDCKVLDTVQYDLKMQQHSCHERAPTIAEMRKDDVAAGLVSQTYNAELQDMLRVQGDIELKTTIDNMVEIITQLILIGPCIEKCHRHGDCIQAVCLCDLGYTGEACAHEVPLAPGECPRNCSNHGVCVNGQCQCEEGWKGVDCSMSNVCENGCSGHGDCIDGVCDCYTHWRGTDCSIVREICPDDYKCYRGECVDHVCECYHGWTGDDCTIGDFFNGTDLDPDEFFVYMDVGDHADGMGGHLPVVLGVIITVAMMGGAWYALSRRRRHDAPLEVALQNP